MKIIWAIILLVPQKILKHLFTRQYLISYLFITIHNCLKKFISLLYAYTIIKKFHYLFFLVKILLCRTPEGMSLQELTKNVVLTLQRGAAEEKLQGQKLKR